MKIDKKKKGIAPDEVGELPNEYRCKQDFGLLIKREVPNGKDVLWCMTCGATVPWKGSA